MLRIRLSRKGAKKKPFYRIVVAERRSARDGSFVQSLGYYNPRTDPIQLEVDLTEAENWIKKGAQPSDTVGSLLKIARRRKALEPPAASSITTSAPVATPEARHVEPDS
ncbi:MAG: 30S ribosomal protein S16 [Acidobacteria bacterium]|nr:30S ribosomal protein S16 [Acidobacteriota bacterium]MBI3658388.1 30S ribosomal protein S16 [Acidobacteriota bacterium]